MNSKFTQTDLNLAINYITLERLIHCMGIDAQLFDEHEELPVIFSKAKKGTLDAEFHSIASQGQEGLISLFQKLHDIFGIDFDIITGKRQVNLGIGIYPGADGITHYLAEASMGEIYNYIEEQVELGNLPENLVNILPLESTDNDEEIRKIEKYINERCNELDINIGMSFDEIISIWKSNPLRINTLGVFVDLVQNGKVKIPDEANTADKKKEVYKRSFESILTKEDGEDTQYKLKGKQNIYCLDALIYYILRCEKYYLLGLKAYGEAKHKILDEQDRIVPYPLGIYCKQDENNVFTWDSDLWIAISHLKSLGYAFEYSYGILVEYSTIQEEIEHYQEDIIPRLQAKCDTLIELIAQGLSDGMDAQKHQTLHDRLEKVQTELKDIIDTYIPSLEASQANFDRNKDAWVKNQLAITKASVNIKDINDVCRKIEKMANKKKGGGPWIKVREPYYIYIPLESRDKKKEK